MKRLGLDVQEEEERTATGGGPEDPRRPRGIRPVEMLPTLVTLGNVFSGFLAIAYLTDSLNSPTPEARIWLYEKAIFLIFLAMGFDAVDGWVARKTGQSSDFGAQVDSICDAVSFGVAPAILFKVICEAPPGGIGPKFGLVLAVLFLACAVLRLARFNLETSESAESHESFEGLPTPAAAAVVAGLAYANISLDPVGADSWVRDLFPYMMPLLGLLMVSRLPYVHAASWLLKRKSYPTVVLLVFLVGIVVLHPEILLPLGCVGFMVWGPLVYLWRWITGRGRNDPVI